MESKKPGEEAYEHFKTLLSSLLKLKALLEKHVKEGAPFPSRILYIIQKWEKSLKPKEIPKEALETAPKPEQTVTSQTEQIAETQTEKTPTPQKESPPLSTPGMTAPKTSKKFKSAKEVEVDGRKIALFLIENEPEKPLGYRLLRSLRWDLIEKPPLSENGQARMEVPLNERITFIQNLILKREWKRALLSAEKEFSSGVSHFLLDLQRVSSVACKELGKGFKNVNNAICYETALFIRRIPDVISLSYSDGTPFCDNATKDWIDSDVKKILSSHDSSVSEKDGSCCTDPLKNEKKEINLLSSAGKFDKAIKIMQEKINGSGIKNQNFKRELIICNLLFSVKRADIALAILESLHEKIMYYHLDEWEPDLAVETWCLLVKAYKIAGSSKPQNIQVTFLERQNSILNKISCIDPNSSLQIKI